MMKYIIEEIKEKTLKIYQQIFLLFVCLFLLCQEITHMYVLGHHVYRI